jgi:hypothetical protein
VVPYWLVDGFAAGGPPAIPDLLESLGTETARNSDDFFMLLAASVGRMGPRGAQALPVLHAELAVQKLRPARQAALRVVMANLGDHSEENLQAILAALGDETLRLPVVQALVIVRAREWVTAPMIRALNSRLNETSGTDLFTAVALGMLGEKGAMASRKLDELIESELEKGDGLAHVHTLILANITPREGKPVLRRLLGSTREIGGCMIGGAFFEAAIGNFNVLIGPLIPTLVELLDDANPKVSERSLGLASFAGLSARDVVPEAIRLLRGTANEGYRADVASTLSFIANYSDLPTLDAVLKVETSAKVRKNLSATIRYIRNFELVTWYGPPEFGGSDR